MEKKQQLRGAHNHDNPGSGIQPDTVTLLTGDTLAYSPIFIKVEGWVQSRTLNEHEECKETVWHGEQGWCICGGLAAHQCDPGSNPSIEAICGLSLLLVLSLATRGFSLGTPVFPSPQKPIVSNSNSIWKTWIPLNEFIKAPKCYVGKQITIYK